MVGIFERFYNHQGELRWKFIGLYGHEMAHTHVEPVVYPEVIVTCQIKRAPKRIFTYCKAPANYMRG
jgi:hypothetical protein